MGGPMAVNLLRAGFTVVAYDTAEAQRTALQQQGVVTVASVQQAIRQADVVITMLPSDDILIQVLEGPDQLLNRLTPNQILIDMGTSKLATSAVQPV